MIAERKTIYLDDALEAIRKLPNAGIHWFVSAEAVFDVLLKLPSAQPEQDREFIKLTVENSNGRPYYSIIYLEIDDDGVRHYFEGYSSYSLDVISDYLKKYFMPSVQPERKKGKWIMEGTELSRRLRCSCCSSLAIWTPYAMSFIAPNFCPNCGADMREVSE